MKTKFKIDDLIVPKNNEKAKGRGTILSVTQYMYVIRWEKSVINEISKGTIESYYKLATKLEKAIL